MESAPGALVGQHPATVAQNGAGQGVVAASGGLVAGSSQLEHGVVPATSQALATPRSVNAGSTTGASPITPSQTPASDPSSAATPYPTVTPVAGPPSSKSPATPASLGQRRTAAPPSMLSAFTVQCALCFKWRRVPTLEEYEGIRARVSQTPFVCEQARRWKPKASCSDPSDLQQDGKVLWAIDRPDIPVSPAGWRRRIVVRGGVSNKFSDVYYYAPDGKMMRSTKDVEKYLKDHPEFGKAGITVKNFSFSTPRPLNPPLKASPAPAAEQDTGAAPSQVEQQP